MSRERAHTRRQKAADMSGPLWVRDLTLRGLARGFRVAASLFVISLRRKVGCWMERWL